MLRMLVTYDTPIDPEAFEKHYTQVHVPLGRALPGILRYTLGRPVGTVRGRGPYLVAALDWPDMATMQASLASPEGQAAAADAANLVKLLPENGMHNSIIEVTDA